MAFFSVSPASGSFTHGTLAQPALTIPAELFFYGSHAVPPTDASIAGCLVAVI